MILPIPTSTINLAYSAGYDCAVSGANTTNCHFKHFASPEHTAAWELGKREGERVTVTVDEKEKGE